MTGIRRVRSIEERICSLLHCPAPETRWSRVAFWALVVAIITFLLRWIPGFPHVGFSPWFVLLIALVAAVPAFFRWVRWMLLWRLRNRLFVTYALIGLTPIVLFGTLAAIAAYVLFGQFANFAAMTVIRAEQVGLASNTEALALHFQQELATQLQSSGHAQVVSFPAAVPAEAARIVHIPGLEFGVYLDGKLQQLDLPPGHALTRISAPPAWVHNDFRGLILSGNRIYFAAISRANVGPHTVVVMTGVRLDSQFLGHVVYGLGTMTVWPHVHQQTNLPAADQHRRFRPSAHPTAPAPLPSAETAASDTADLRPMIEEGNGEGKVTGGVLPKAENFFDFPITFPTTLDTTEWSTGNLTRVLAQVTSRPSLLYRRLFQQSLIGGGVQTALITTAAVFAFFELLAIFLAIRLSRTITRSVSDLYHATREVDQGRLNYRIPVSRRDQLAALSRSFNAMSESLVRSLEQQKEKERMEGELEIAQEVQSNLFPSCDIRLDGLELHGLCRPARTVSGDYYDFLVLGDRSVCMAIGDISGKGISAALLMAGLHSAVRAFSLGGKEILAGHSLKSSGNGRPAAASTEIFQSPASLMRLLNLHLYGSTQPEKYATLFLANYEVSTRTLRYSNGGQLPPLVLRANGSILRLDRGGTVIGLLDDMQYEEGALTLQSGDLLVAYSDGVTEPENEFGDFGEARMVELIHHHRHRPLPEISECVMQALKDWIGAEEQPDDITLVLARQS